MSRFTAEELRNRFQLPDDAIQDLLTEKFFDSKPAGRLRLGGESLCPVQLTYLNETEDQEKLSKEPKHTQIGRYVCEALSLADCDFGEEGFFEGQIFVWIPTLRVFASWDCEHEQSYLFPGVTWETISKDPVRYLCSQWEPIEEGKNIWDLYELWKEFPYVIYAGKFFEERLISVKKNFDAANYQETIRLSSDLLQDAKQPLIDEGSLIRGKVESLCYKIVSSFLLNEVESALDDFETMVSVAKQGDLEAKRFDNPDWNLRDARQKFSVLSSSLKEREIELWKKFILGLMKRNNEEASNLVERFCSSYPEKLNELLKILHSSLKTENALVESAIVLIAEKIKLLKNFQNTIERMKSAVVSEDFYSFHHEFRKIDTNDWAFEIHKSGVLSIMNDALISLLKKREIESGRSLVHVYSERLDLIKPSLGFLDRKVFEELFANALCLIHSNDETNREFLKHLERKFLPIVRENGAVRIMVERLGRNLACVYTTMDNFESAYFFLKLAMERGAKKEDILGETDFDPLRREERFVLLFKKYYQESPN